MRRKMWLWLLLLMAFMVGCSGKKEQVQTPKEGVYKIYYLNSSMTKLMPQEYYMETQDQDMMIQELMNQFLNVPNNVDSQVALSDKVGYLGYRQEERVLFLYFDAGYGSKVNMNATREILCRAALTKTMTQIEGIDYISIYVADQPLLDSYGNPVGVLSDSDFIEGISDINAYEKSQLQLFFADESGEHLLKEEREVVHSINTSVEKVIVEELIKGPQVSNHYRTLPADTKLLNVSLNENICYINFDATFLNNNLEIKEYIPIYSIVNSLSEISTVSKVQITINGSQDVMFRDVISLNTQFERNLEIGEE